MVKSSLNILMAIILLFVMGIKQPILGDQEKAKPSPKRRILYKTEWTGKSEEEKRGLVKEMEYAVGGIRNLAEKNHISIERDKSVRVAFTLIDGKKTKEIKEIETNSDLWDICKKFYGIKGNEKINRRVIIYHTGCKPAPSEAAEGTNEALNDELYFVSKLKSLAESNHIQLKEDPKGDGCGFTLVDGNRVKDIGGGTDVDVWQDCQKFFGIK